MTCTEKDKVVKCFHYFEIEDGGMYDFPVYGESDLAQLHGWMSEGVRGGDEALLSWMNTAEVGTMQGHRLGVLVRMKDSNAAIRATSANNLHK